MFPFFGDSLTQITCFSSAEGETTWLHSEKVSSWPGSPVERGWRYLRTSLEQYDNPSNDYAYCKAVSEKILEFDRSKSLPSWLISLLQENQPEYLIRTFLRFELISEALKHSLSLVQKVRFHLFFSGIPLS